MKLRTRTIFASVILIVIIGLTSVANAVNYTMQSVVVGSSAMFNTLSAVAFTDLCSSVKGSDCHHWSKSGSFRILTSSGVFITYNDPISGLGTATVQGTVVSTRAKLAAARSGSVDPTTLKLT